LFGDITIDLFFHMIIAHVARDFEEIDFRTTSTERGEGLWAVLKRILKRYTNRHMNEALTEVFVRIHHEQEVREGYHYSYEGKSRISEHFFAHHVCFCCDDMKRSAKRNGSAKRSARRNSAKEEQEEQGGARRSKEEQRGAKRRSKEEQGGARRNNEQGARRSKKEHKEGCKSEEKYKREWESMRKSARGVRRS
jgi:hypothetical protein